MKTPEIRFKEGSVQETGKGREPQAFTTWTNHDDHLFHKKKGAANQSIMPLLLAGAVGLGGGNVGTQFLNPAATPEHVQRVADTLERVAERLEDKIDDLEKKLDDLEEKVRDLEREMRDEKTAYGAEPMPQGPSSGDGYGRG